MKKEREIEVEKNIRRCKEDVIFDVIIFVILHVVVIIVAYELTAGFFPQLQAL